ncbi:MAG: hypothetical protein COW73_09090 [Nitrospirae bacterium CG18_big_fil_WC_8_21_14_2_50_70_55]|nr:hypothetical protein [Deltaproteobacteria bacterium]OIP67357.1 MAG: hypothetical protein AUK30_00830 [Nitrospirae bacterium CG2_30_70_394]PIQ04249.1 MAG: hypothetical protein COW73_09090 [Nitrospirae bacterium CG18_big_fil_WC_8_21_14_2_50_70_55]PIU78784.1 MAG: hypothetical protein COS73_06025 [Nitrospirae bacterium CG06_land_8_20_14_3_00_70_43]PIW83276.1 MAG: hypothetical protein COZ96_04245 [Nitrospirae bacterium CG_4_8_14_3_um_filter_70_85]PIX82246.1 MAG: hypothetical protein COZ33_11675 
MPCLRPLLATLLLATLTACGGSDSGSGNTFTVADVEFSGPTLVVAAADFTGAEGVVFAADPADATRLASGPDPVSTDVVLRAADGRVYALNRTAGNLQLLDPARGLATGTSQFSTGAGSNPHDLAVVDGRAYVSRYGLASLLVIDPTTGSELATIDLATLADGDQIPEMDRLAVWQGKLVVTLQRLDENSFFAPTDHSSVAIVDPTTNQLTGHFDLASPNPVSALASDGNALFVATTGSWGVADGGIERLNPDLTGSTTVVEGAELDGDLGELAIVSPTKGYVVVSGLDWENPNNRVVAFNPTSGAIGATVYQTAAYLPEIATSPDHAWLAIADRNPAAPGVVLVDPATDQVVSTAPINNGERLPPSSLLFLP